MHLEHKQEPLSTWQQWHQKIAIMEDQNELMFFQIQLDEFVNLEAHKYIKLGHFKNLYKLHWQLRLAPLFPSLLEVSLLIIVIELLTNYTILPKDPNLGASAIMHNGPNVCEEKDEESSRINKSFDTQAFNLNEDFYFNQVN